MTCDESERHSITFPLPLLFKVQNVKIASAPKFRQALTSSVEMKQ